MMSKPILSIIIPVLNEAATIAQQLSYLTSQLDKNCELIIVDGGSRDNTVNLAMPFANRIVESEHSGRALQMNAGAAVAKGDILLFLHIDTRLPSTFLKCLCALERKQDTWGFFSLKLSGTAFVFRVIERAITVRSRITSIATGDQCLFMGKTLFNRCQGYATIALMEDVEICKRLRKYSPPVVFPEYVITSSRRWEEKGILQTVLLMWRLRFLYFLGVSPNKLAQSYR